MTAPRLESVLTCPHCGHAETLIMPTEACRFFHVCTACKVLIRPLAGDCCVFCSYGDTACPPMQAGKSSCTTRDDTHQPLKNFDD
jgi:hypothetical protein